MARMPRRRASSPRSPLALRGRECLKAEDREVVMHRAARSSVKAVPWELEDHVDHPRRLRRGRCAAPRSCCGRSPRAARRRGTSTARCAGVSPQPSGRLGGTIHESVDGGVTFHVVGRIDDEQSIGGLCCATLYALPAALGALPAGALLWAASVGGDTAGAPMAIPTTPTRPTARTARSWSPGGRPMASRGLRRARRSRSPPSGSGPGWRSSVARRAARS